MWSCGLPQVVKCFNAIEEVGELDKLNPLSVNEIEGKVATRIDDKVAFEIHGNPSFWSDFTSDDCIKWRCTI